MKSFINHSLNVGNVVCFFCKVSIKIGAPLYTRCYSWGHNTNYCNSFHMVCPICDGPHHEDNHHTLAACCKGHPKQVPPVPPMENPVSTRPSGRIVANFMPQTLLTANSGNIVLTISGLWNDMRRWMSSDLVCILLLGKLVTATKLQLQGVVVEMVGRHKPIKGDLDLFSVQDYPCRYGPCPVAHNVIKLGVCSYMSNSLFAPILFSRFDFSCYYSVYALSY